MLSVATRKWSVRQSLLLQKKNRKSVRDVKGVNNGAATLRLLVFFGSLPKIEKADCGSRKHRDHHTLLYMNKSYLRNGKLDI